MAFLLEVVDNLFEVFSQLVHAFQIMFRQRLELLNCVENVDQLQHTAAEKVQFSEDLSLTEIEGFAFRHVHHFILGLLVTVLVLFVQFDAV